MEAKFVRISELAKEGEVLASTIRHYTDRGLLAPAMDTEGGQHLYDLKKSLKRLRFIKTMSKRGLNLEAVSQEMKRRERVICALLIDDENEVVELITSIFEHDASHGEINGKTDLRVHCEIARDGFTAGRKLAAFFPDIVILDLMLPGINGFQICRLLRADEDLRDVKILAITGYDTPQNRSEILAAGADGYLAKPFELEEFVSKFKEIIGQ